MNLIWVIVIIVLILLIIYLIEQKKYFVKGGKYKYQILKPKNMKIIHTLCQISKC